MNLTVIQNANSALKAIHILEALKEGGKEGFSLKEISDRTDLNKSTAYRIISALVESNYVLKLDDTKRYKLSYKILQFNHILLDDIEVKTIALPYLKKLSDQLEETVHLVQRDGNMCVYIEKVESPQAIRLLTYVGKRSMLHCSASGKVILAYMNEKERFQILKETGMPRLTHHTITELAVLEKQLKEVLQTGLAWNLGEDREDIIGIAAPIFDASGNVVATIAVPGPSYRFSEAKARGASVYLKEITSIISNKLGFNEGGKGS